MHWNRKKRNAKKCQHRIHTNAYQMFQLLFWFSPENIFRFSKTYWAASIPWLWLLESMNVTIAQKIIEAFYGNSKRMHLLSDESVLSCAERHWKICMAKVQLKIFFLFRIFRFHLQCDSGKLKLNILYDWCWWCTVMYSTRHNSAEI